MVPKTAWAEWSKTARKLFEARFKGWPKSEFMGYHKRGMSPLLAYEAACQRRKPPTGKAST